MLCFSTILLLGCHTTFKKPPVNAPSDDANIKLAEAAASISDSMMEMARVEKVITPPANDNTLTIPNAYNLQTRVTIDWAGPIQELVSRIAQASHYQLHVLGKEPSVPILVNVSTKDESLGQVLRNLDYQATSRADIHVYPNRQVIELRYAKLY